MNYEALGNELLREVKEESLTVFLQSLRETFDDPTTRTCIPSLDKLLNVFQKASRTRPNERTEQPDLHEQLLKEESPTAIEVTGTSPCSGKTQLLYHIISLQLLPPIHNDVHLQGKDQAVVLLDLSGRFSVHRLEQIIRSYINLKSSSSLSTQEIVTLTDTTLSHLHIFYPHSTPSLVATLSHLPAYLLAQPFPHISASRPLGLIALNDLSSFYYQDRQESEEVASTSTGTSSNALLYSYYHALTTTLRSLSFLFSHPLILATNYAFNNPTTVPTTQYHHQYSSSIKPHLPPSWYSFLTCQLLLSRDRVTKFPPGMSAEEAWTSGEKERRWKAVKDSGFSGRVNWWGAGGWREEVREGVRRWEKEDHLRFFISEAEVRIPNRNTELE